MPKTIEIEKAGRLAALKAILQRRPDGGAAVVFAAALFERGSAEDLIQYSAEELAGLVEEAWHHFLAREPGRPRVRVFNPALEGAGGARHQAVTVVEILNDNMPFLVDSVMGELTDSGSDIHLVLHPILTVRRDMIGRLDEIRGVQPPSDEAGIARESFIHIHIGRIAADTERDALAGRLDASLADVRIAVGDWRKMLARLDQAIAAYRDTPPPLKPTEIAEAVEFLEWLRADNFTLLGMRDYAFTAGQADGGLARMEGTALGVLTNPEARVLKRGREALNASQELIDFLFSPQPLVVTKSNLRSRVHRRVRMDYVGVKLYAANGELAGELRILGLFTSTAYTQSAREIPYIRGKLDRTIARAGFDPVSHSGKALLNVLESYPRGELFQLDADTLYDFAMQIMALDEHPRVRVLAREDTFGRFVSVLVFVPRERYSTEVRVRVGEYLERSFKGRVVLWQPAFPEGSLARVHFIIGRYEGKTPVIAQEALETAVAAIVRTWTDALEVELCRRFDPVRAAGSAKRFRDSFGAAYREAYGAEVAVHDIALVERLTPERRLAIDLNRRPDDAASRMSLKLYHLDASIPLSDRVPVLENIGLRVIDERTYRIAPADAAPIYLHDMTLERADGAAIDLSTAVDSRIEALFMAVWFGRAENDGFNVLGLTAGLGWREIALIRALARYLRQVGIAYSQDYVWGTLQRYPAIAASIVQLFTARFDPERAADQRAADENRLVGAIETALESVASLDDDTILRRIVNVVRATVRSNFFQLDDAGRPLDTLAFKLDSKQVTGLPEPKPFREIWVYSPRVEGIHMRFGAVARGGLRWTDRPQDFRTEVLGLVKAQQVKNAVIVPAGAKGGFLPKWLKPGMARDAWLAEGTAAYKIFVATLLSVTDNLDGANVLPPPNVVRHDGDDPYLVVAADKGTATFSDTANAIAEAHGFWLGDAFASGGSAGYDHKKMAITARGAFEAVKRHFRETDIDILAAPFTVAGVGDMSGDVFGNGMLLAPTIRLVAAFDHRDIFLDPNPDRAASLAERRRLFALPRSSWGDYDRSLISTGGGVFPRAAKSIELSAEVQALLGLSTPRATPQEVLRAILKAPVDLLWFGGIGTYVRAGDETDADAGDRANDSIRVTAAELRAKVIGEGANLGLTQRGRIEFNLAGGRCNSDAIDNSAGVNSSDVEVNIKIALGAAMRAGLIDRPARDRIMVEMTGEVAGLVLRNNYLQTLAVSMAARQGLRDFGHQRRFIEILERSGHLKRTVEALPDDAGLNAREKAGKPLTRAELGVLLAYGKMVLKEELLASAVPDDAYLAGEVRRYFPSRMREDFGAAIDGHKLRREIIATGLANAMINRGGPTFVTRIAGQTGAGTAAIALAFAAARDTFGLNDLDDEIDRLDSKISGALQLELYGAVQDLLQESVVWFLRNVGFERGLQAVIARFRAGIDQLRPTLDASVPAAFVEAARARTGAAVAAGVPAGLAQRIAFLPAEASILDVVLVSERSGCGVDVAAMAYFAIADRFRTARLAELARSIRLADYYDGLALDRAQGLLADAHRRIASEIIARPGGLEAWLADHGDAVERTLAAVAEITGADRITVSRFAVAAGEIADLAARV